MRRRGIGLVIGIGVCIAALSGTALAAPGMIKNGSFEKPVVPVGGFQLFPNGGSFSHWTVVGAPGNVGVVSGAFTQGGFTFPAKAGQQWLDLTGITQTATGVAETVATTAHTPYTLMFAVGNVVNPGGLFGTTSTVNVFVDGSLVLTAVNSKGAGSSSMVWKSFSVNFLASASTTTISFMNADPASDTNNGLDAVKLSSAP
jgi:Protein of unknown function (DUF642)